MHRTGLCVPGNHILSFSSIHGATWSNIGSYFCSQEGMLSTEFTLGCINWGWDRRKGETRRKEISSESQKILWYSVGMLAEPIRLKLAYIFLVNHLKYVLAH